MEDAASFTVDYENSWAEVDLELTENLLESSLGVDTLSMVELGRIHDVLPGCDRYCRARMNESYARAMLVGLNMVVTVIARKT